MVVRTQKEKLEDRMDAVIDDPVNHPSHYTSGKIEVNNPNYVRPSILR